MATFTCSFDGTRVTNADSTTGWTGDDGTENEYVYQGDFSIAAQLKDSPESFYYVPGSTLNYQANSTFRGRMVIAKTLVVNFTQLDTQGAMGTGSYRGQVFRLGSSTSNWSEWQTYDPLVRGSYAPNDYPARGGFQINCYDPNIEGWITWEGVGIPDLSAIDYYMLGTNLNLSSKSTNVAFDAIDVLEIGKGISGTGGDGGDTDGTFQDFVDYDEGIRANRYGVVQTQGGIIYINAMLCIANSTQATSFTDSNRVIVPRSHFVGSNTVGIHFNLEAASDVTLDKMLFQGVGAAQKLRGCDNRPSYTFNGTTGTADITASTFSTFQNVTLSNSCSITGSRFINGDKVYINAANLVGCTASDFETLDFTSHLSIRAPYAFYANTNATASNTTLYTNIPIGEPAGDRYIVTGVWTNEGVSNTNVHDAIYTYDGGNTSSTLIASMHRETGSDGMSGNLLITDNPVTTGTIANVKCDFLGPGAPSDTRIFPYIVYGVNSTPITSNTEQPAGGNLNIVMSNYSGGEGMNFFCGGKTHNSGWGEVQPVTNIPVWDYYFIQGEFMYSSRAIQENNTVEDWFALYAGAGATIGAGAMFGKEPVEIDRSYFIWNDNINPDGYLDNMTFIHGEHRHHAIEFGTSSPTTLNLNGLTFTGYGADDSFDAAIYIARTSGSVTINASDCSGLTYKSAGADVTVVADPVTVRIDTRDINNNAVSGARVYLRAANGDGPFPFEDVVTITNAGTTATVAHTGHSMATNDKVLVAGASHIQNRGIHQITVANTTHYTYTMSSAPGSNPTGTITSTFVALEGNTVSGFLSTSRVYSANLAVTGVARKATGAPYYKTSLLSGIVTSSDGFQQTAIMTSDGT